MSKAQAIPPTNLPWKNWSGNLEHKPPTDGSQAYFYPETMSDLKAVLAKAKVAGVVVRVSGQRHSQPPLVAADNRAAPPAKPDIFIVDMSCYCDIDTTGMMLGPGKNQVTVNPGVREDDLDAFLTKNDLMFKTVTAGGFFSLGGMTAVDVHGATVGEPIFAETASAFALVDADGNETTIDARTPKADGWSPLQFVRVSLGGLGIVTRITLDVQPRPYATTLVGTVEWFRFKEKSDFVQRFQILLHGSDPQERIEAFYSPYALAKELPSIFRTGNMLVLSWKTDKDPVNKIKNSAGDPPSACALADKDEFGAPELGGLAKYGAELVRKSQFDTNAFLPGAGLVPSAGFTKIGMDEIESQAKVANRQHSDLWLSGAVQVMFMSYFVELPDLGEKGLGMVWDGITKVGQRAVPDGPFHLAAPLEFRFIKAGDSAMSGTYSDNPDATFINFDLIGFIEPVRSQDYPDGLLSFFAEAERDWVAMGGFPHNGKMYGFYDPATPRGQFTGAFNPAFLEDLRKRRGKRLQAYKAYRQGRDPQGRFLNGYLKQLLGD